MKCSWNAMNGMKKESAHLVVQGKTWTFAKRIKFLKVWIRCVLVCYIYAIGLYFYLNYFAIIMLLRIICKCFIFLGILPTIYTRFYRFLFFILNSDLLVVLCSRYTGWCRNIPDTNPRWLRPCFDPSLSTMPTETPDEVSRGNYITPDETLFIRRTILISSLECLQMVKNLRNSFVDPSCLGQTRDHTDNLPKRSILTSVSFKVK